MAKIYKKGIYSPTNTDKYAGKTLPRYLSGWELKFFVWCDSNPAVLSWCSEKVIIPYYDPVTKKMKNYFVDNLITVREGDKIRNYLIEIKPYRETIPPTITKKKKASTLDYQQKTYQRNLAKWDAAKRYAQCNNCVFMIFTEKVLDKLK